jgi:serine/threonine protein kinase
MTDYIGQQFGSYRIIRKIGQGGFAEVFLGEHVMLKTPAAIKLLQVQLDAANLQSFMDEARVLLTLRHAHIMRVLDMGVERNIPFLVMEYAPKGSLRGLHPAGSRLPLNTVVHYTKQAANALQYSHTRRLIHRDIKPENMLVSSEGEVMLSDFGLAVQAHSTYSRKSETISGTLRYMAPEQFSGHPTPASDQYTLAIVVYEWLCGTPPFDGNELPQLVYQHTQVQPPALRSKNPSVPPQVEQVVLRALAKNPAQRFPTVQAFALALEQATKPPPLKISPRVPPPLKQGSMEQRQVIIVQKKGHTCLWVTISVIVVLIVVVLIGGYLFFNFLLPLILSSQQHPSY